MLALDLNVVEIAQDRKQCLRLSYEEKQQISAKIPLMSLVMIPGINRFHPYMNDGYQK